MYDPTHDSKEGLAVAEPPTPQGSKRTAADATTDVLPTGRLNLSPRRVLVCLLWFTLGLTVLSVGLELVENRWRGVTGLKHAVQLLSLNGEANIPAWYSSFLWLAAAGLAFAIALHKRATSARFVAHWLGFAAVCAYLSLDEAAMIHETAGNLIGKVFRRWSFLRLDGGWIYSWMYYGIGMVAVFLLVFRRFLLHLPKRFLLLLVAAGATYLAGALGVESISAAAEHEKIELGSAHVWDLVIGLEECLEMTGVVLLIYALLTYMRAERVTTTLAVAD